MGSESRAVGINIALGILEDRDSNHTVISEQYKA